MHVTLHIVHKFTINCQNLLFVNSLLLTQNIIVNIVNYRSYQRLQTNKMNTPQKMNKTEVQKVKK